ncbi:hypothetical protein GMOD_00009553 [Pyrenophora seminiperda CCB06]|uniref:Uncharacterized protein n=1 Tax=Pyrenophora seminiperda CCB06 TaxID=1302712 RepID=A0A3M7MFA8_9PLEO|nr:hypothetical protein GMOD_00009553 [Pyrenophora seminiperda CCB06]
MPNSKQTSPPGFYPAPTNRLQPPPTIAMFITPWPQLRTALRRPQPRSRGSTGRGVPRSSPSNSRSNSSATWN